MKKTPLAIAIGLVGSTMLVGCGGDSSDSTTSSGSNPTAAPTYSVTAIDGYLQNAQVWLDINGNFQLDKDTEPTAITGKGGIAKLDVSTVTNPEQYPVIVKAIAGQTIDEDTISSDNPDGTPITAEYVMSAPAGETAVTPLSTLVHVVLEQTKSDGDSTEDIEKKKQAAVSQVAEQLGIDKDDVLGDFIEADNKDVSYVAENIVEAKILPGTPAELDQVVEDVKSDPDGATFLKKTEAASNEIKKVVETVKADDSKSFEDQDSVFEGKADLDTDTDNDGVADAFDAFVNDPSEWVDNDGDEIGDNADDDDDNDKVPDTDDAFPLNKAESADTDGDFLGDNADPDDDNDGVADPDDAFPYDKTESVDTDGDKIGNNADPDDDNDGYPDDNDSEPLNAAKAGDHDKDGYDSLVDEYPDDPTKAGDHDGDGHDSINDAFPDDKDEWADNDKDGYGDNLADSFPDNPDEWVDADNDGYGDNKADLVPGNKDKAGDHDEDGIDSLDDNCPYNSNPDQADVDADGIGDICDTTAPAVWNTSNWNESNWQ